MTLIHPRYLPDYPHNKAPEELDIHHEDADGDTGSEDGDIDEQIGQAQQHENPVKVIQPDGWYPGQQADQADQEEPDDSQNSFYYHKNTSFCAF